MKKIFFILAGIALCGVSNAQDFDDIYYSEKKPKKAKAETVNRNTANTQSVNTASSANATGASSAIMDVDAYNRRGFFAVNDDLYDYTDSVASKNDNENFTYTDRVRKYHNPDVVEERNDSTLNELYYQDKPITINLIVQSPNYWDWYDPWYSWRWRSAWYYDPWYYDPWWTPWRPWGGVTVSWGWGWTSVSWGWGPRYYWGRPYYWRHGGWVGPSWRPVRPRDWSMPGRRPGTTFGRNAGGYRSSGSNGGGSSLYRQGRNDRTLGAGRTLGSARTLGSSGNSLRTHRENATNSNLRDNSRVIGQMMDNSRRVNNSATTVGRQVGGSSKIDRSSTSQSYRTGGNSTIERSHSTQGVQRSSQSSFQQRPSTSTPQRSNSSSFSTPRYTGGGFGGSSGGRMGGGGGGGGRRH